MIQPIKNIISQFKDWWSYDELDEIMRDMWERANQPKEKIVAGDSLTASSHLKEVYPKTGRSGTMVFVVWETTFRNQKGQVVADVQESFAARE